jgi:hypothetical protein
MRTIIGSLASAYENTIRWSSAPEQRSFDRSLFIRLVQLPITPFRIDFRVADDHSGVDATFEGLRNIGSMRSRAASLVQLGRPIEHDGHGRSVGLLYRRNDQESLAVPAHVINEQVIDWDWLPGSGLKKRH